jgi:hypothetical protein
VQMVQTGDKSREKEKMTMSQQEKKELEVRCRKFGLNCEYLMHTKTEKELDHLLTFRAHKAIHRSAKRR